MLGTYASFLVVLGLSALVGQAAFAVLGRRTWSRLAPAVGLAVLLPVAWAAVRLPGRGTAAIIALAVLGIAAASVLRGRLVDLRRALRIGVPLELIALVVGSLPFILEWRFGILGTGLNPDMSQHLFAADALADGASERLISHGYPLGPHALVVAASALGPSLVQAFDGLQLAVAVATCLAALTLLESLSAWRRIAGALVVGFAYLLASYFVQGAFKETIEALFVLAFAIGLSELARGARRLGAAVPLALLAAGSVYAYSFPGLVWLAAALAVWALVELALATRRGGARGARELLRVALGPGVAALAVAVVLIAPEAGRLFEFASFETFNPDGAGLGNLFDRLSPLEALGIWPSGDFRVEPGAGAVPAIVFYLGAALGAAAVAIGLVHLVRRKERALPAALVGAALLWLYALVAGTPYQEAKALVLIAPLVAIVSVLGLLEGRAPIALALAFLAAAGGSSILALVNGPVGPSNYSPALAELRPTLRGRVTYVFAPHELLSNQQGRDYLNWELRGNRICIRERPDGSFAAPPGASWLVVGFDDGAVVPEDSHRARHPAAAGRSCPLITPAERADPGAG
ncbi:MAG TPA: hypothetical protein VK326_01700 [Solirubrobacterales bacterium]|nr:hypothetical protein [Solirubrobacterales bacterium]